MSTKGAVLTERRTLRRPVKGLGQEWNVCVALGKREQLARVPELLQIKACF